MASYLEDFRARFQLSYVWKQQRTEEVTKILALEICDMEQWAYLHELGDCGP